MAELQKVNQLLDVENTENNSLRINQVEVAGFSKLKAENISETIFLKDEDEVIIYGQSREKPEKAMNKGSIDFKLYSTSEAVIYSYLDRDINREADGMLKFSENIFFNDKENIIYLDNHVVGVPKGSEVYLYPLFAMVTFKGKRLVLYWSEKKFSIESKEYILSNNEPTNVFIDHSGNVAISYLDMIATFRFEERSLDVNGYHLQLEENKQVVKLNKKWIELSSDLQFNGEDGVVRYQYTYVKVPQKASLVFDKEELKVTLVSQQEIKFLAQVDRLVFREDKYWLVFDINSRIVLDKNGDLAFIHQENLAVLDKNKGVIKVQDMNIIIADGAIIRVTKDSICLNEVVKINVNDRIVRVAKSKFFFLGQVNISLNKAEVVFGIKEKQIRVMPYKKQLFLMIGGKLVIVTVSIGIAVDGNGNIAFDYQNSLTTLDTDYFVMNIGGAIFSFGAIEDCCVEFLGNQIAVGSQKQNVLELLKTMVGGDISESLPTENLQDLIETLLCTNMSSFLNSNKILNSGIDMNMLMELVKGSILGKVTGTGESCFAIMNKDNMDQLIMGDQKYTIQQGNNFYVPVNMEFLQGSLKFKDNKVYFV